MTADCLEAFLCGVEDVPFVETAIPASDSWEGPGDVPGPGETTATVTQPEPGRLCLSGRLEDGWALLTLVFSPWDPAAGWTAPLDAVARGITSFEFTLDTPPQTGVYVQLVSAVPDCTTTPGDCQHWGFFLHDTSLAPERPFVTNQGRTVHAELSDFRRMDYIDSTWEFDPSRFSTLQIGPGALASTTGDYSFCIRDLRFLNADGEPVSAAD